MTIETQNSQSIAPQARRPEYHKEYDMIPFDKISAQVPALHSEWQKAEPFSHIVIDNFLPPETADRISEAFDATTEGWVFHNHYNERKYCHSKKELMAPEIRELFDELESSRWLNLLGEVTGIPNLLSNPSLDGASGLNKSLRGCYLNMHRESFGHNEHASWKRQLNLLLYLTKGWQDEWEGALELYDHRTRESVKRIAPMFNRLVIFHTNEIAFHGLPTKLVCPEGSARKSVITYYFTDEGQNFALKPVYYQAQPSDPLMRRFLIGLDNALLRIYFPIRKYTPIDDEVIDKVMRFLKISKD